MGSGTGWRRCRPGVRPGGRPTFFSRTRQVGQRSAPHWPWPCGQPAMLVRGAALPNSLRAYSAPFKQRQRVRARSAHASLRARPTPCASRHGQKGVETHSGHRCARPWVFSLCFWERVGLSRACRRKVRATQFKNRSCSRLFFKRWRRLWLEIAPGQFIANQSRRWGSPANTATGAVPLASCARRGAVRRACGSPARARTCTGPTHRRWRPARAGRWAATGG